MSCILRFSRIGSVCSPHRSINAMIKSLSTFNIRTETITNPTSSLLLLHNNTTENIGIGKIDPTNNWQPRLYKSPPQNDSLNLYFGFPNAVFNAKTELDLYDENKKESELPGIEKPKIHCHKTIIITRKRKMRKHRRKRWIKRHLNDIIKMREIKSNSAREKRIKIALDRVWQEQKLSQPPEELTAEDKKKMEKEWREAGIWTRALTEKELFEFSRGPPVFHLRSQIPDDSVWRDYRPNEKK